MRLQNLITSKLTIRTEKVRADLIKFQLHMFLVLSHIIRRTLGGGATKQRGIYRRQPESHQQYHKTVILKSTEPSINENMFLATPYLCSPRRPDADPKRPRANHDKSGACTWERLFTQKMSLTSTARTVFRAERLSDLHDLNRWGMVFFTFGLYQPQATR